MAKPLGIVAMLTLLATSGTALADHHFPLRAIDDIKVTNTNKVYFELKNGYTMVGDLPGCDVMQFADITGKDNLGLFANANRFVKNGSKITFLDLSERPRRRVVGSCKVSNIGETDVNLLLAKS